MDALRLQSCFSPIKIEGRKDSSSCYGDLSMRRKKQNQTVISSTWMSMNSLSRSPSWVRASDSHFPSVSNVYFYFIIFICVSIHIIVEVLVVGVFDQVHGFRKYRLKTTKAVDVSEAEDGKEKGSKKSGENSIPDDAFDMDDEERQEWRKKIREVISKNPAVDEEADPDERRKKMQKLLADYPLVVDEDDPNWPEDADGWGFSLGQFFNKITIKNVKKDDDDNYDSENEIVWQDDDYIRPIKDITSAEWEEAVFKDISPLVVLVHNRYKRFVCFTLFLSLALF